MTSEAIELEAAGLQPGERIRIKCPTCGGDTPTLSIAMSPEGLAMWYCFRAVCSERGNRNLVRTSSATTVPRNTAKPYKGELVACPEFAEKLLNNKVGWDATHLATARPLFNPEQRRIAFPIYAPNGARRGYVLRGYEGWHIPKALTFMDNNEPHISWYGIGKTVILVEDIPSAVRASKYVRSAALCGTHAPPEYVQEIAANASNVIWALDADALGQSVKQHRANSLLFNSSTLLPLERDIKDMAENDLADLLKDYQDD